jgi:polyphosphate:AMP phosphotransferase
MLELIDLKQRISKTDYDDVFPGLTARLGECQRAARQAGVPAVIVFEGWDAAGKGTLINALVQALDPRGFKVHAISKPNREERLRPWLWRFWNTLPAAGEIAIFDRSWYGRVLIERMAGLADEADWRQAFEDIRQFERRLTDGGVVLVKLWLHLGRGEQKRRFRRLERDPSTAWKVGKAERQQQRHYREWLAAIEEMLEETDTTETPWTMLPATQARWSRLQVFQTVVQAIEQELAQRKVPKPAPAAPLAPALPAAQSVATASGTTGKRILDRLDLSLSLSREEYEAELEPLQEKLFRLEHELYLARIPAVIAFEGCDAAGKGGTIKRLTSGLDPRGYEVVPIAAPTDEEKARPYLWRFWRRLPKAGHITIFDRTWYGRVLVECVEGFCTEAEWRRAYEEINEFERQLLRFGTVVVKFWLHIDQEEQLRRFLARQQTPEKQWKITDEDWRNREKWPQYEAAINEMLERTSTHRAPWTILEANCKLYARIKALRTVAGALQRALDGRH